MKIFPPARRTGAMTLIEVSVIVFVIAILGAGLCLGFLKARERARLIGCNNNLKQIGLAFRVWEANHNDKYPMEVLGTNGGTRDFNAGLNAYKHFQIASNELSTPVVLFCPAESAALRIQATNFRALSNSNISYFVGLEASETNSQMLLSGDHYFTNSKPPQTCVLPLTTNDFTGWTLAGHNQRGNIALSDGRVQIVGSPGFQSIIANTGLATNWIQMPILNP